MRSTDFPQANKTYGGERVGQPQYNPLRVQEYADEEGNDIIRSAWLPDDEERRLIASGRPIYLEILGTSQPPVRLAVGKERIDDDGTIKPGDVVTYKPTDPVHNKMTCLTPGQQYTVKMNANGTLVVHCEFGEHYLDAEEGGWVR